jgi:RimJ/RimL family protein N-acetyltransferase
MKRIPFTRNHAHLVADFDCGTAETYQTEVADWIRNVNEDVWEAIGKSRLQVWLYLTEDDDVIGFASLALQVITLDESSQQFGEALMLPYYALRTKYHKKPDGPWQQYYSRQILRDLLAEARKHPSQNTRLGLYVHPNNTGAIRLYEQFGFSRYGSFAGYLCMVKDLGRVLSRLPALQETFIIP